jgi:hypothetical protein
VSQFEICLLKPNHTQTADAKAAGITNRPPIPNLFDKGEPDDGFPKSIETFIREVLGSFAYFSQFALDFVVLLPYPDRHAPTIDLGNGSIDQGAPNERPADEKDDRQSDKSILQTKPHLTASCKDCVSQPAHLRPRAGVKPLEFQTETLPGISTRESAIRQATSNAFLISSNITYIVCV